MNNVVSLSQLITRLAKVTDTDINTSRRFLRSLFAAVEEQLLAGESVTIKGIGTFRPNVDGLVAQGQSVLFIPDAELAAAVNAPFDMFEPVELAGGVNFDDEAEEIAPEALESAATAEAPAAVEKEVEEVEVPEEVMDEESPAAEHEDVAEWAVVSEPEAETEELAETEASIPEPKPLTPIAARYVFPEEEEGELPPDEPLRAPVQRNSRMWIWILLIVAGGGLLGYLFAQLDSEEESYGVDAETEVEAPVDTTSFEEVAVEELAASAAAPMPVVAEENVAPEPQPEPVVEAAPVEKKEEPVYDTVTGTNYLAKMARKYYGRSSYWVFIYQANTDVLDNPDRIKPGTKVLIPPKSSFAGDTEAATQRKADALRAELDRKYK
ncbi:MAG: HU family DNA-binding protein [Muribaculaceae bacterium]|nr:HU family DNA-binding protein [Muribaculaceae bacterium]